MKKLLYVVGALIGLILIVPIFLPSDIKMSRSIEINRPPQDVFNLVADFNNYLKWNPWSQMEPTAKNKLDGTPKEPGHSWHWEGEKVGIGTETIVKVEPGVAIETRLDFISPMEDVAKVHWRFEPANGGTKAVWTYEGHLDYLVERYMGLMLESMLGPSFEQGLQNVKKLAESAPGPENPAAQ